MPRSKKCANGKNLGMGKTFDKAGASLLLLLLSFLLFFRLTRSLITSAIAALLLLVTIGLFLRLLHPRSPKALLSKRNFIRYILLNGTSALKKTVVGALSERYRLEDVGEHTLLICGEERILVYYAYKFGSLSEEDVAKSYRIATANSCGAIYALTNHLDRKALAVAEYIPQKLTVINATTLYKFLLKKGLIPKKEALPRKSGKAIGFFKTALKAENAKFYVWAGLTTALLALFTPITTYYIVFSFLNLALAVATIALSERSDGVDRLFKE